MKPLLEAKQIYFSYTTDFGKIPIIKNLSFSIARGEFVAIQGPSGSGKSTLLYLIGCMNRLDSGEMWVGDVGVHALNRTDAALFRNRYLGFVFQQFHLLPKTSVADNILLPTAYPTELKPHVPEGRVDELLHKLSLQNQKQQHPNQLSGGQQQRVAIGRALINGAPLILADEPTGNLDSANSKIVMEELQSLQKMGHTIVLITHDREVAEQADRILYIQDGQVVNEKVHRPPPSLEPISFKEEFEAQCRTLKKNQLAQVGLLGLFHSAAQNLARNKIRSLLTMIGITIGVSAVLSMLTLGNYAKDRILSSYAEMGINTLVFYANVNWDQKASDQVGMNFSELKWEADLQPLKRIFPEIIRISPFLRSNSIQVSYGGKILDQELRLVGVNEDASLITGIAPTAGTAITAFHVENKNNVCLIGSDISERLFANINPLGEILKVSDQDRAFGCRIIGVLPFMTTRSEWRQPNLEVYVPFTFFQAITGNSWSARIRSALFEVRDGTPLEETGKSIRAFFQKKYGNSGRFRVDADSVLLEQMNRFLNIFTVFLATVALISMGVGGIGITNMMLVSLSERYREIGLRKALGATDLSLRFQFLWESLLLSALAGLVGLIFGFIGYQLIIWGATRLVPSLKFEWVFNLGAISFSVLSIVLVGILSGLIPAFKAERLTPLEALRSD